MTDFFSSLDSWLVALVLALSMVVAWRWGRSHGRKLQSRLGEVPGSQFENASLALLGLLIGFSFSMAMVKHDSRRQMVVTDANAIADFYTCASLLKEPLRSELQGVIRNYAVLRLDLARQTYNEADFEAALAKMQQMQGQMTDSVDRALQAGTPIAVSLTNTLNAVTSVHASRLFAVKDRLPAEIVYLLLLSAVVCSVLVGREQGASNRSDIAGTVCFIVLVTFAVYVTLDLNQPERGLITISQEPIQRVLSSISK